MQPWPATAETRPPKGGRPSALPTQDASHRIRATRSLRWVERAPENFRKLPIATSSVHKPNVCSWPKPDQPLGVHTGNKRTFVHGDCQRHPSTRTGHPQRPSCARWPCRPTCRSWGRPLGRLWGTLRSAPGRSDVVRRERDDDLGRPPVNLRLSFQVIVQLSCGFLLMCSGYYSYAEGHAWHDRAVRPAALLLRGRERHRTACRRGTMDRVRVSVESRQIGTAARS